MIQASVPHFVSRFQDWMKYGGGIDDLLSKVVIKSLSLIADADSSVRRECAKFIGLLLQNTPPVSVGSSLKFMNC